MARIVRLTESDLTRIVRRVISEQTQTDLGMGSVEFNDVIIEFYKKSITQTTTGEKVIYGKTNQTDKGNYQLMCYCTSGKTMLKFPNNKTIPMTVLSPNWRRFCK
jgi:hypothetical protein